MDPKDQEIQFYKKRSNDLGGKILKFQEEITSIKADERRYKLTAEIIGKAYHLSGIEMSVEDFYLRFLQIILEGVNAVAGGIFAFHKNKFVALKQLNLDYEFECESLKNEFLYRSKKVKADDKEKEILGFEYFVWDFDKDKNRAILICRDVEDNRLHKGFEEKDKYLLNNIISVLVDVEQKKRLEIEEKRLTRRMEAYNNLLEEKVKERTSQLVEQKKVIEHKNIQITDSINYAKRIQEALLPSYKSLSFHFPESFVFFKPRDTVSGDFYWMEPIGSTILFAVADCTGHGVPGAMVSVVCIHALKRCVREFGLIDPAKILDKTREIVIETFNKNDEEVNDGMDIALCSFNTKTAKLKYAGSNSPLIIVRNKNRIKSELDGLEYLKPHKEPIGNYMKITPFKNHETFMNDGDFIYMATDGYQDQFGGNEGKKLMKKTFREILFSIAHLETEKQQEFLQDYIHDWMGGEYEQLDDICIMGIKF